MAEERSLLQQIREKEMMISIKIDETRRESEEILLNARKEASEIIETSERQGKKAAQEYYEREMEKLKKKLNSSEIRVIKRRYWSGQRVNVIYHQQ
jgi:hypothetical protein